MMIWFLMFHSLLILLVVVLNNADQNPAGKRVYVPLQFWFCRNPGLALPLIALQYHEVKVNLELDHLLNSSWCCYVRNNLVTLANSMLTMSTLILMKEEDSLKYHTNTLLNKFNSLVMNHYCFIIKECYS